MTQRLGIGVVGAGAMSRVHSVALRTARDLYPDLPAVPQLEAIADIDLALAKQVAARFGYSSASAEWRDVIENSAVDVVAVCLPPACNRDVVVAAAEAGKHVLCEKPLSVSAETASEMLSACEAAGVKHTVATGLRWCPALRAMRELVRSGRIGEVRQFRGVFDMDYAADPSLPLLWRFRADVAGGGAAADTGYHVIDSARFLVDEIEGVVALTRRFVGARPVADADWSAARAGRIDVKRRAAAVDVEDAVAALVGFSGGAYGVIEASRVATGNRLEMSVEVYGSDGSVQWSWRRFDEFRFFEAGDAAVSGVRDVRVTSAHPDGERLLVGVEAGTGIGWLGGEAAMWAAFIEAIAHDAPISPSFEDGVRACEVVDAIYESARRTEPVEPGDRSAAVR